MSCVCEGPGYCPRHKMDKPAHMWLRCRGMPEFCRLQDRAHGIHAGEGYALDEMPSARAQAWSLVRSLFRWAWIDGLRRVGDMTLIVRRARCQTCPQRQRSRWLRWRVNRCRSCGCFISLKTLIPSQGCPKEYWNPVRVKAFPMGKLTRVDGEPEAVFVGTSTVRGKGCGCAGKQAP